MLDNATHEQLHVATYEFDQTSSRHPFEFRLAKPARLIAIRVNGQLVTAERGDNGWTLPPVMLQPPGDSALVGKIHQKVSLHYTCPLSRDWFIAKHSIVVPESSHVVTNVSWKMFLASAVQPTRISVGLSFAERPSRVSWTRRLFGPLGRTTEEVVFAPYSGTAWLGLVTATDDTLIAANRQQASGWRVWTVHGVDLPRAIVLSTWNRLDAERLGWVSLLVCLGIGIVLRVSQFSKRDRIAAGWLSLALTAVIFVPPAFTDLAGGCFTGSLIAALLPRRLLNKRRSEDEQMDDPSPTGSIPGQVIIKLSASLVLLSALFGLNELVLAQDGSRAAVRELVNDDSGSSPKPYRVIIPESDLSIVYVPNGLLAQLRENNQRDLDADYVISNAQYVCDVDGEYSASVLARYRISILKPHEMTRIHLPITGAVLHGADACQVNGKPTPILPAPDAKGFLLEIGPTPLESSDQPKSAVPPTPDADDTQTPPTGDPKRALAPDELRSQVVTLNVELRLRVRTKPIAAGASMLINIPAIPSRIEAIVDRQYLNVGITGAAIQSQQTGTRHQVTGLLQSSGLLEVAWSTERASIDKPPTLEAAIYTVVESMPTRVRYHVFARYRVSAGKVNSLEWRVPAGLVLRDLQAAKPVQAFLVPDTNRARMIAALSQPESGTFTVYGKFEKPLRNLKDRLRLPLVEPVFTGLEGTVTRNQVGFATTAPFQLTTTVSPTEAWSEIDTGKFRADVSAAIGSIPIVPPVVQNAFQINRGGRADVSLSRQTATRQIWKNLSGIIHADRIEWKLNAEIRTSQTGAFSHTLGLDRRLTIESINVLESGVNRLVRWSRIPHSQDQERDQVILFLSGSTDSDLQNLELNTTMPHGRPAVVEFPSISLSESEIAESRVQIYLASGDEPTLIPYQALERLSANSEAEEDAQGRLLGRFNWDESKRSPQLRFDEPASLLVVDRLLIVQPSDSGRLAIQFLRFKDAPANRVIKFTVPKAAQRDVEVKLLNSDVAKLVLEDTDDALQATVHTSQVAKEVVVSLQTSYPRNRSLTIDEVQCDTTSDGSRFLVIAPQSGIVDSAMQIRHVGIGELPEWIANLPISDELPIESLAFQQEIAGQRWRIAPNATDPSEPIRVTLEQHEIRLVAEGNAIGTTRFLIVGSNHQSVRLNLPSTVNVKGIQIDGRAVSLNMPSTDTASDESVDTDSGPMRWQELPLITSIPIHEMLISWTHSTPLPAMYGVLSFDLPKLEGTDSEQSLVLFAAESTDYVIAQSGASKLDPAAHLQKVYDSLRQNVSLIDVGTVSEDARADVFQQVLQRDVAMFRALLRGTDQSDIPSEQRQTFKDFDKQLAKQFTTSLAAGDQTGFQLLPVFSDPSVVLGHLTGRPVSAWIIRESTIVWPAAGVAVLMAMVVIWRLIRFESAERLARHPSVAWCLLGLLWWQCLTPSPLGLLFVVRGGWLLIRPSIHRVAEPEMLQSL